MNAEIIAVFKLDGSFTMRPASLFQEHDAVITVGIWRTDGHIRLYDVAVYGERNPYRAYLFVEAFMADYNCAALVCMLTNDYEDYKK